MMGTIVRDTNIIIQTARKMSWDVDLVGQFAAYDTAVASLPGGATEGFYCMTPALYAYPDDPRPEVQDFAKRYKARYGRDPNFHGEVGYTAAQLVLIGLQNAGKDLTVDSFIKAMEGIHDYKDIFGSELSFGPEQHHGSTRSFLTVVKNGRWVRGRAGCPGLLIQARPHRCHDGGVDGLPGWGRFAARAFPA